MLAFADATRIDPLAEMSSDYAELAQPAGGGTPSLPFTSEKEIEKLQSLPSFTGRVEDIKPSDLAGSGSLVKHFAPRILRPSVEEITLYNSTTVHALPSDLVRTFEFDESDSVLMPDQGVVAESSDSTEEILRKLAVGSEHARTFLEALLGEVPKLPGLSKTEAGRVLKAITRMEEELVQLIQTEFSLLRESLERLSFISSTSERILVETPETLSMRREIEASSMARGWQSFFFEAGLGAAAGQSEPDVRIGSLAAKKVGAWDALEPQGDNLSDGSRAAREMGKRSANALAQFMVAGSFI